MQYSIQGGSLPAVIIQMAPGETLISEVGGRTWSRGPILTETKGGKNGEPALRDADKIKIGCAKKHFEAQDLGNDFHYNVRTTYQYEAVKA